MIPELTLKKKMSEKDSQQCGMIFTITTRNKEDTRQKRMVQRHKGAKAQRHKGARGFKILIN
jgi:hypothetical protein